MGVVAFVRWRARIGAARFLAGQPGPADPSFIDSYLIRWDRFAQGDTRLVPYIRNNKSAFEHALSSLLREKPSEGAVRAAFYAMVQVGGFIDVTSELGVALTQTLGARVRTCNPKDGVEAIFAGDLYEWFNAERGSLPSFPPLEDWLSRDFAQTVAIPMYKSALEQR